MENFFNLLRKIFKILYTCGKLTCLSIFILHISIYVLYITTVDIYVMYNKIHKF